MRPEAVIVTLVILPERLHKVQQGRLALICQDASDIIFLTGRVAELPKCAITAMER
jgi:hypothetical protein